MAQANKKSKIMKKLVAHNYCWGYMVNGQFQKKTNFTYTIKYNVQTDRQAGYVVDLVRSSDETEGSAFYGFDDLQNAFCFTQALNSSFGKGGGLFCTLKPSELIELCGRLDEEWRVDGHVPRNLVTTVGKQQTDVVALNPDHFINTKGETVNLDRCNYVWLPDHSASPPIELGHFIEQPTDVEPLQRFFNKAKNVCSGNFAPTMLAILCMYPQCHYRKIMELVGHYNLPLLYSQQTQVGKTLAASCAGLLIGSQNLYSRCTLAYLTARVTSSTLPFVWDDPTSPADVSQLTVDLGDGAIRGSGPLKSNRGREKTKPPLTGCLVTANFSLSSTERAGTRTVPIIFSPLDKEKEPGEGIKLQEAAKIASAAFPVIYGIFEGITKSKVSRETSKVKEFLPMLDLRLQEGLAIPLLYLRMILNETGQYRLMPEIIEYIKTVLYDDLSRNADIQPTSGGSSLNDLIGDITGRLSENGVCPKEVSKHIRVTGEFVALRPTELAALLEMDEAAMRSILTDNNCTRGQVRLPSGNKKCYKCNRANLEEDVISKLKKATAIDIEHEDNEEEEEEEEEMETEMVPAVEPRKNMTHMTKTTTGPVPESDETESGEETDLPLKIQKRTCTSFRTSSRKNKGHSSKHDDYIS